MYLILLLFTFKLFLLVYQIMTAWPVGKINKFLDEQSLVGQNYVKDPSVKVSKVLAEAKTKVISFERLMVGEGIEKQEDNFAEEVMQQAFGKK